MKQTGSCAALGFLLAILSAPLATSALADDEEDVTYTAIGLGRADSGFDNLDQAVNIDLTLGLRVPTIDWISAEIGFATTLIPGENTDGGSGGLFGGGSSGNNTSDPDEFAMNSIAVSGVLRSTGRVYLIGKAGYRYVSTSIEELNESPSGSLLAGGVGWRWGESLSGVELQYTRLTDDIDQISLGVSYGFGN
jgi:hypothetical protein